MHYLGDAAKVAEHLEEGEFQQAQEKARALLQKRFSLPAHWDVCSHALEKHLSDVARGDFSIRNQREA